MQCELQQFSTRETRKHRISALRVLEQTLEEIAGNGHAI